MKNTVQYISTLILFLLLGCHTLSTDSGNAWSAESFTFSQGGCWMGYDCTPSFAVTIYPDGKVVFDGHDYVHKIGKTVRHIPISQAQRLLVTANAFRPSTGETVETRDCHPRATDAGSTFLVWKNIKSGKETTLSQYEGCRDQVSLERIAFLSSLPNELNLNPLIQGNVKSVLFTVSDCMGMCPEYSVEIFPNGKVDLTGIRGAVPNHVTRQIAQSDAERAIYDLGIARWDMIKAREADTGTGLKAFNNFILLNSSHTPSYKVSWHFENADENITFDFGQLIEGGNPDNAKRRHAKRLIEYLPQRLGITDLIGAQDK